MSPLYTYNNKLLVSNGALAASENCCCESSSSSSSSFSSEDDSMGPQPEIFAQTNNYNNNNNFILNEKLSKTKSAVSVEMRGLFTESGEKVFSSGSEQILFDGFIKVFRLISNNEDCLIATCFILYEIIDKESVVSLKLKITNSNKNIFCDKNLQTPFIGVEFNKLLDPTPIEDFVLSDSYALNQVIDNKNSNLNLNTNITWIINLK